MNDTDNDDKTMFVGSPPQSAENAPAAVADNGEDDDDKTVMIKPSQRSREAAAALSAARRDKSEDVKAAGRSSSSDGPLDFDVTAGSAPKRPAPKRSRPNYAWIAGFAGTIAIAALGIWLLTVYL